MTLRFFEDELATPIGAVRIRVGEGRLYGLGFADRWDGVARDLERRFGPQAVTRARDPHGFRTALERYFSGDLQAIAGLPTYTAGTPFQECVWAALRRIPIGATVSYTELARAVGSPSAVRAVAGANAANPVSIVIPCHRVIRADGELCGYGGGVERKAWLLDHERAIAQLSL